MQYCSTLRPLSADQLKALKKHAKLANNSAAEGALAPETFESFATVLQGVGISLLGVNNITQMPRWTTYSAIILCAHSDDNVCMYTIQR